MIRRLVYLPFVLILAGLLLSGVALTGVQTVLFGYGFHFREAEFHATQEYSQGPTFYE